MHWRISFLSLSVLSLLAVCATAQCNYGYVYTGSQCMKCSQHNCNCESIELSYCSDTNNACYWYDGSCTLMDNVPCYDLNDDEMCAFSNTCGWVQTSATGGDCIPGSPSPATNVDVARSIGLSVFFFLWLVILVLRCWSPTWRVHNNPFLLCVFSLAIAIQSIVFAALGNNEQVRFECPTPTNSSTLTLTLQGSTKVSGNYPAFYVTHFFKGAPTSTSLIVVLYLTAILVPISFAMTVSGHWKRGTIGFGLWVVSTFTAATFALSFVVSSLNQSERIASYYCSPIAAGEIATGGILTAVVFAILLIIFIFMVYVLKNIVFDEYQRLKWAITLMTLCGRDDLVAALKEQRNADEDNAHQSNRQAWSMPLIPNNVSPIGAVNNNPAAAHAWDLFSRRLVERNETFSGIMYLEGARRTAYLDHIGLSPADGYQVEIQWNQRRAALGYGLPQQQYPAAPTGAAAGNAAPAVGGVPVGYGTY